MKDVFSLLFELLTTLAKLARPGGSRAVIVDMKQRNPRFGCPRIAQQINLAFGLDLDKDTVRRVLAVHFKPGSSMGGASTYRLAEQHI